MTPGNLFVAIAAVSVINGLVSPALILAVLLAPSWLPGFVPMTRETVFYGASLIVSLGTLLLSGIPAALYERLQGQAKSDSTSMLIWLAGTVLLTLPGLARLL